MVAFYNQGDQNIYKDFQYVPQEKYRLGFTAPVKGGGQDASTPSFGIPNTNAFTNSGGGEGGGIKTLDPYSTPMSAPINSAAFRDPLNEKIANQMRTQNPNLQSRTNAEIIESNPDMFDIKTNRGFYQNTVDNLKNMGSLVANKFSGLPGVEQGKSFINNIMDNTMVGRFAAMRNPLNPNASNYNKNLQGQIDFLEDLSVDGKMMIGKNPSSGLAQYGPDSVLSGQNVVSGFGTNDYGMQLQDYKDKYGHTMSVGRLEQLEDEIAALEEKEDEDYKDRIDSFVENYSRPGVKGMFDTVYDGVNIHGGTTTDGGDGGGGDGFGGYENVEAYDKANQATYDRISDMHSGGGGGNIGGKNEGNPGANKSEQSHSPHFAKGGRAGYFFGGRVNFKNGGLASIL